jgi:hypothetical protein
MIQVGDTYIDGKVPVGTRIRFAGEKQMYTVRASNVCFAICTKPMNALKTVLYSIIDWNKNIRGTENLIFGMGAETDEDCKEMLERMTEGESEVSHRNNCELEIEKVIFPKQ